jgi:hypothetical protein
MSKTIRVDLKPVSVIKLNLGLEPKGPIQAFFTNTCYKAMDEFVPMSNLISRGSLRKIVDIQPDSITYEMPYAEYQYYGMWRDGSHKVNPDNYTTPGTGPYWDNLMVSSKKDEVVKAVQKELNRLNK